MQISEQKKLYQALVRRDSKYDGRFYFGVITTGIYCRPICPARPKFENVRFYRSQAEAESKGFRPCLRCRPDLSPLSPQWRGSEAVIGRALAYIRAAESDVAKIAESLGMSDRHLRRLFEEHLGSSPMEVAVSYRLHLARQLLSQTPMKIIDVAMASGFQSLRRFNDAFVKKYRRSPSSFRKNLPKSEIGDSLRFEIPMVEDFDFANLLKSFRNHQVYGVDYSSNSSYERHLRKDGERVYFKISWDQDKSSLIVHAEVTHISQIRWMLDKVRRAFDLSHNPGFYKFPKKTPTILKKAMLQARVQGSFDHFESVVCIILGQLVSTEQGRNNIQKLVENFGEKISKPWSDKLTHDFPTPQRLLDAEIEKLGFTKVRAEAIRHVARLFANGKLDLEYPSDFQLIRQQLLEIRGIGPWTAEMIALRCLRDPDAIPESDLIVRRALEKLKIQHQDYSPWRAYLCVAIWNLFALELSKKKRGRK